MSAWASTPRSRFNQRFDRSSTRPCAGRWTSATRHACMSSDARQRSRSRWPWRHMWRRSADRRPARTRLRARSRRTPAILGTLGAAYARDGRIPEARKILKDLSALAAERYVSPHAFTWVYFGLGDKDAGFNSLAREYEDRSNSVAWIGSWHMLDGFRNDPRYAETMRRIGLSHVMIPTAVRP